MTEKRGRGRPRRADADAEILAATTELLRERGYRDFSVDVIAERTGIAKTTIYRRWPSKGALVAAAIAPPPEANDARAILEETASVLTLLAQPDGEAVDVLRAMLEPRRALLIDALEDAVLADALIGVLVTRFLCAPGELPGAAASAISRLV